MCYDCTDRASFNTVIDKWSRSLARVRPDSDFSMVLVACKIDLRNAKAAVSEEEGRRKAEELSRKHLITVPYLEVSALRNILCTEVFSSLVTAMVKKRSSSAPTDVPCSCALL